MTPPDTHTSSAAEAARALLEVLFEHYVSGHMILNSSALRAHPENGFPPDVLSDPTWAHAIPLVLDPEFYDRMNVVFEEHYLTCNLSFDELYAVQIPYSTVFGIAATFGTSMAPPLATPKPPPAQRPKPLLTLVPSLTEEGV